jgi:glycosyltransferase involved in cell wall biosynthesis
MINGRPQISVCIPTFNRASYLPAALDSVLQQTRQDFEIIVFDDASTDGTPELMASIRDDRVRYFRQPQNAGIARNRNCCLEAARGEYIAWLDSDDLYFPHMLATQSAVLDQHPEVGLVFGGFEVMDADGKRLPDWAAPFNSDAIQRGLDAFAELVMCNHISTPTVMLRRECYERVGHYAVELGNFSEDWEMWLRIALHFDMAYTARPLASIRWHEQSTTFATARAGRWTDSELTTLRRVFSQYPERIPNLEGVQRRARAAIATRALFRSGKLRLSGHRRMALAEIVQALGAAPWLRRNVHSWLLLAAVAVGRESAEFRHSKIVLNQLYADIAGSRYGESIRKQVTWNAEWDRVLRAVAKTVRRLVPRSAAVALVDKWDPTLLGLCRRKGWHFPDMELSPGGYPKDSEAAIDHLEQLIHRGARYLVFPNASFWWLEHYGAFREHLDATHRRLWADDDCIVFQLHHRLPRLSEFSSSAMALGGRRT